MRGRVVYPWTVRRGFCSGGSIMGEDATVLFLAYELCHLLVWHWSNHGDMYMSTHFVWTRGDRDRAQRQLEIIAYTLWTISHSTNRFGAIFTPLHHSRNPLRLPRQSMRRRAVGWWSVRPAHWLLPERQDLTQRSLG